MPSNASAPNGAARKALRDPRTFRALNDIWFPSDDAQLERLLNGDVIPLPERKVKHVQPGQKCTGIPAISVAGLLEQGDIEVVGKDAGGAE